MSLIPFFIGLLMICSGTTEKSRLDIIVPSPEEEAEYIWNTLQDIKLLEEFGYPISLPQGELIESLKAKSRAGELEEGDLEELKKFMREKVYRKEDYAKGNAKIQACQLLLNSFIDQLEKHAWSWNFKTFEVYEIHLTLYGSGGSYNAEDGGIWIFTNPEGGFRQYDNPANTLIHEIVHIGVEASIIGKYKVPHSLKERIIDQFVLLCFGEHLPDYTLQDMGDYRIDAYLKKKEDLEQLDQFVQTILKEN